MSQIQHQSIHYSIMHYFCSLCATFSKKQILEGLVISDGQCWVNLENPTENNISINNIVNIHYPFQVNCHKQSFSWELYAISLGDNTQDIHDPSSKIFSSMHKNKRHLQEVVLCRQEWCCSGRNLECSSIDTGTGIPKSLVFCVPYCITWEQWMFSDKTYIQKKTLNRQPSNHPKAILYWKVHIFCCFRRNS